MHTSKLFFLILGMVLLVIGAIGVVVPLLPTTPLIIAAFVCFTKSSKRAENWISNNRYFGSYIENYKTKRGVPYDVKIKSIAFLWITLSVSMIYLNKFYLYLLLLVVGVAVTIHIITLKTRSEPLSHKKNYGS